MAGRRRQSCSAILTAKYGPTKVEFKKAQNGICPLCGKGLGDLKKCSFDHVHAHSKGHKVVGNVLLTHGKCNGRKSDDDPHPAYVEILDLVNFRLGWNGSAYQNCKNYKLKGRLMSICWVYQDHGIPVYMRDGKRLHVTNGRFDADVLIAHLAEYFPNLSYAEGAEDDDGVLRLVHNAFKTNKN